ncbi:type ISP restriction/modification enzyme [Chloroflexota bacterium]
MTTHKYIETFWEELTIPGPYIPITKDHKKFEQVSS